MLCLHGFAENSISFSKRIQTVSKPIEDKYNVKFIFPIAPFLLDPSQTSSPEEVKQYGWLYLNENEKLTDVETNKQNLNLETIEIKGLSTSHKLLEDFIKSINGTIECILGFSQGASMTNLFLIQAMEKKLKSDILKHLKCCILISGVGAPLPSNVELAHVKHYASRKKQINIPALVMIRKKDQYVKRELNEKLANFYKDYEIYEHEGKHTVPYKSEDIAVYMKFLDKYLK